MQEPDNVVDSCEKRKPAGVLREAARVLRRAWRILLTCWVCTFIWTWTVDAFDRGHFRGSQALEAARVASVSTAVVVLGMPVLVAAARALARRRQA